MKTELTSLLVLIGAGLAATGVAVAGQVEVTFVDSARYSDAGAWGREREANLATLASHVQQLAAKHLTPGQALKVEFLDVDLAGNSRPSRRTGADLRVLRGRADWPRLTLRYSFQDADGRAQTGTESISDMNYLWRIGGSAPSDSLAHEKRLLNDWFLARIVAGRTGG